MNVELIENAPINSFDPEENGRIDSIEPNATERGRGEIPINAYCHSSAINHPRSSSGLSITTGRLEHTCWLIVHCSLHKALRESLSLMCFDTDNLSCYFNLSVFLSI